MNKLELSVQFGSVKLTFKRKWIDVNTYLRSSFDSTKTQMLFSVLCYLSSFINKCDKCNGI